MGSPPVRSPRAVHRLTLILGALSISSCSGPATGPESDPGSSKAGRLKLSVTFTGAGVDPDGLDVLVDGVFLGRGALPGSDLETELEAGEHVVAVSDVGYACRASLRDPSSGAVWALPATLELGPKQVLDLVLQAQCTVPGEPPMAVGAPNGGGFDVFRLAAPAEFVNLTRDPADDFFPSWSPVDGSMIAFVSNRDDPIGQVFLMNHDGSGVRRLTTDAASETYPTWSPDKEWIAFSSDRERRLLGDPFHYEIFVARLDGGEPVRLTTVTAAASDYGPAWSPDGTKIVFQRFYAEQGVGELWTVSPDGTDLTLLRPIQPGSNPWGPAWSPDGSRIVFALDHGEFNTDIGVMSADGSGFELLTDTPDLLELFPAWDPAGATLAFQSYPPWSLERVSADGSGRHPVYSDQCGLCERPTFAPALGSPPTGSIIHGMTLAEVAPAIRPDAGAVGAHLVGQVPRLRGKD